MSIPREQPNQNKEMKIANTPLTVTQQLHVIYFACLLHTIGLKMYINVFCGINYTGLLEISRIHTQN